MTKGESVGTYVDALINIRKGHKDKPFHKWPKEDRTECIEYINKIERIFEQERIDICTLGHVG